ncbi:MAG: hypothetical protein SFV54_24535 [Bryobacteraceae bacterium]|nr:hypothetical protein [Bryobacteraceae bacterium]
MNRLTFRTSTIFIGAGNETKVYRRLEEVPPQLRKKLIATTNGRNSATILIADRKGRRELARAVRSLPAAHPAAAAPSLLRAAASRRALAIAIAAVVLLTALICLLVFLW